MAQRISLTERWYSGPFPPAAVFDRMPSAYRNCILPHGRLFRFAPGEVLVKQSEPNEWLHVILDGRVGLECLHGGMERSSFLEQIGPGELVGEYGLVDTLRTPYTARAITPVRTLRFQHLAIAAPLYYGFRELVPTFQATLQRRIDETTARGVLLGYREDLARHCEHDDATPRNGVAHDLAGLSGTH